MAADYLEFDRVTKSFGDVPVVQETSLAIEPNSLVVFLGPSGCGKTTLMRMIGGLDMPSSGVIRIEGVPIAGPGRRTGMVFQSYSSFPWLTVAGNINFGMLMPGNGTEGGTDQLLFTAGPDDETHGLLGTLTANVG